MTIDPAMNKIMLRRFIKGSSGAPDYNYAIGEVVATEASTGLTGMDD